MKSMKKLVLAGLVLLASVLVLLPLVGCKNDSVPEVPKYTVKFETEHWTAPASITVESGTKLTTEQLKALPDTEDNIFEGWYDGETQAKGGEYTVTKDVTLVARWRNRDTVASVTFGPSNTKFYYDEMVTVTLATATEGATIQYKLNSGDWQDYSKEITVTSDTTITAKATKEGLKDSKETSATYTVRKLTSITVTPPTRTVYSEGEKFDSTGMVLTATYDDGEERNVTGTIDSDTSSLTKSAGNKEVTVSYTEGDNTETATFTVDVVDPSAPTKLTSYISPNHTDDTWTYVAFGEWPQSEVKDFSPKTEATSYGIFKENYYEEDDGKYVKVDDKYYLVEPIIWRVLNSKDGKYNESENPLLLAENILTGGIEWGAIGNNNYQESNIRKWLNGNSSDTVESDYNGDAGFLQTAFTTEAQRLITPTTVDNSATSTLPNILTEEQKTTDWNNGENEYACGDTTDKIFLLSEQEATMSDYGFAEYTASGQGNTRIRVTTDYAKAAGAFQSGTTGYGGIWWLRSPLYVYSCFLNAINGAGSADFDYNLNGITSFGIVPALSISINGN